MGNGRMEMRSGKHWQPAELICDSGSALTNLSTELSDSQVVEDYSEPINELTVVCFGMVRQL